MHLPYIHEKTHMDEPIAGICLQAAELTPLPPSEERVLQCVWELVPDKRQAVTIRKIQRHLMQQGYGQRYTTVATFVRRLLQKGYLFALPAARGEGKALRFAAALSYQKYREKLLLNFGERYPESKESKSPANQALADQVQADQVLPD